MTDSTSSYPYSAVVQITDTIGPLSWQASGVLIAPDEVLTASHVVYMEGIGTATNIVVTPGYNDGSSPYGSADGAYFHNFAIDDADLSITNQQSQFDYAVIHLATPLVSAGFMGLDADFAGGPVTVSGYPASADGGQVDSTQTDTLDPNYALLDGTALGEGSSGGPVWIEGAAGPEVVGLVSSESNVSSTGYSVLITPTVLNQIEAWVQQDDTGSTPSSGLSVMDTTTDQPFSAAAQPYAGPVSGLTNEFITNATDSLNISVSTQGWFIHTGSGNDAIDVNSGTNVLDGGTGSNFLTGGSGTDTFFIDDRAPAADIWSTVDNFHSGDSATIWGVTPSDFTLTWLDGQGAIGYRGLTVGVTSAGNPDANLTLVGYTSADRINGRLDISFGTTATTGGVPGSTFMYIHAT